MTRHIAGFILFSFILGISGIVSFMLAELPAPEPVTAVNIPRYKGKSSCAKMHRITFETGQVAVKVVQSVFNERTNLIDTNLFIERENASTTNARVTLHFYARGNGDARYLASETFFFKPDFNYRSNVIQTIPSRSYEWLSDVGENENLFVVADSLTLTNFDEKTEPRFDENKAFSVIRLKGR